MGTSFICIKLPWALNHKMPFIMVPFALLQGIHLIHVGLRALLKGPTAVQILPWPHQGSNHRPCGCKSSTLTTTLQAVKSWLFTSHNFVVFNFKNDHTCTQERLLLDIPCVNTDHEKTAFAFYATYVWNDVQNSQDLVELISVNQLELLLNNVLLEECTIFTVLSTGSALDRYLQRLFCWHTV